MKSFEKNWLEWCVFAAGSVLVLAMIGYLAYAAATSTDRPALLEVRLGPAEPRGGEFAVPVTVINRGDQAAEIVLIEVQLKKHDGGTERAELQIQLLPGGATGHGFVNLQTDPSSAAGISARAVSFESP
jgi:uncharacterized protein (TIGR02588 family)